MVGVRTRLTGMDPPFVLTVEVSLLLPPIGECDLHLQEHPIVNYDLRPDDFQSSENGMFDHVGIGHGSLGTLSWHLYFNW